jgi:hypothetical protein
VTAKRTVLIVLFIPSVERDGTTPIEQDRWVTTALETFGKLYGGATAFPKARGAFFTATRVASTPRTTRSSTNYARFVATWAKRPTKVKSVS